VHLVIATVGTRGDAQPYVALGKALQARGHRVTLATHEDHRELAESHGLAFRSACGRFRELMDSPAGARWLTSGASIGKYLKAFRELYEPHVANWIREFDGAIADADGVLVHSVAAGAIVALQRLKIPYVVLSPFGAVPSREFSAGLPQIPLLTPWLSRLAHGYVLNQIWKVGDDEVARYLTEHAVAKPAQPLWRDQVLRGVPHLHVFSEHMVRRPLDWPACAEVTGFCFLDAEPGWQPAAPLADFLSQEPTPIYVGFGSMTGMDPEQLATLTRDALRQSKQRAVIGMGWGGMKAFEASDDVLVVEDVPHAWLFPRVSAVVHHCGAGTTAASLRAGRPTVAVPFFGDQTFWGGTLNKLGASPRPVAKKALTATRLAAAISSATSDPRYATRAEALGTAIRAEDGAAKTADRALHHLTRT